MAVAITITGHTLSFSVDSEKNVSLKRPTAGQANSNLLLLFSHDNAIQYYRDDIGVLCDNTLTLTELLFGWFNKKRNTAI